MSENKSILRVTRTKEDARRNYNRLSRWYDLLSGGGEYNLGMETLDRMNLPAGGTVLEVGFGTGRILAEITRRVGPRGRVLGIDLSNKMCQIARKRMERMGLAKQIWLNGGDGCHLPFTAGSLDGIFMGFTLELFDTPELVPVLRECQRTLKPGGQLGIVSLSTSNRPGVKERLYEKAHQIWPGFVDCRPIDLETILNDSGFGNEELIIKTLWGLPIALIVVAKER